MSDFKIYLVGTGGVTDITRTATGMPQNLPEDEKVEMTDWDRFSDFWNRVAKAPLFSEREINDEV